MANRSSNRAAVPEAKGALDKFKYEVANELGVPLKMCIRDSPQHLFLCAVRRKDKDDHGTCFCR